MQAFNVVEDDQLAVLLNNGVKLPEGAPRSETHRQLAMLAKLKLVDAIRWQLLDSAKAFSASLEAYQSVRSVDVGGGVGFGGVPEVYSSGAFLRVRLEAKATASATKRVVIAVLAKAESLHEGDEGDDGGGGEEKGAEGSPDGGGISDAEEDGNEETSGEDVVGPTTQPVVDDEGERTSSSGEPQSPHQHRSYHRNTLVSYACNLMNVWAPNISSY